MAAKRINVSASATLSESLSSKQVLEIQVKENHKSHQHAILLSAEIDGLRKILERKQKEINEQLVVILKKDEIIKILEEDIKSLKIDQNAMKLFSDQNVLLLNALKEEQKLKQEVEDRLINAKDEANDLRILAKSKSDDVIKIEMNLQNEINGLQHLLNAAVTNKEKVEKTCKELNSQLDELSKRLKLSEEIRTEQVSRSRQTEYRTLQKADFVSESLQKAQDEKEIIQDSFKLANYRGDLLQNRLKEALKESEVSKDVTLSILEKIEDITGAARLRERVLMKENNNLSIKLKEIQGKFVEMQERYRKSKLLSLSHHKSTLSSVSTTKAHFTSPRLENEYSDSSKNTNHESFNEVDDLKNVLLLGSEMFDDNSTTNYDTSCNYNNDDNNNFTESAIVGSVTSLSCGVYLPAQTFAATINTTNKGNIMKVKGSIQSTEVNNPGLMEPLYAEEDKIVLLGRYLSHLGSFIMYKDALPHTLSAMSDSLDFSNIGLTDSSFYNIINWLRLMPLKGIKVINFCNNCLSSAIFTVLSTWLLSLDPLEFAREEELVLNFTNNKPHSLTALKELVKRINTNKPEEIKLVEGDHNIAEKLYIITIHGKINKFSYLKSQSTINKDKILNKISAAVRLIFSKRNDTKNKRANNNMINLDRSRSSDSDLHVSMSSSNSSFTTLSKTITFGKSSQRDKEIDLSDRFVSTMPNMITTDLQRLKFPGLSKDDRKEVEELIFPRNSILNPYANY